LQSSGDEQVRNRVRELTREMRLMSSFDALFNLAVAERAGLHNTDIDTLDLLNVLGPMTAGQLSTMTGLSSGATTRLIDRLAREGMVRRVSDAEDRRRVRVEPVYEKMQAVGEMYMPLAEALAEVWSTFSNEELEVILRFVRESSAVVASENARLRGLENIPDVHANPPSPGSDAVTPGETV
jgi:DNA-binding MarR family transcriptional regulator